MDLSELGGTTAGVWTRRSARELLTDGQVDVLVRARTWQVLWPGVYTDGGHVPSPEQRAVAAVLATGAQDRPGAGRPRSVAAGRTAARHLGLPLVDDWDPATRAHDHRLDDVLADRDLPDKRYRGRTLLRRNVVLPPADRSALPGGLWVTTLPRTLLDLGTVLLPEALVCAVDAALHRELCTVDELAEQIARSSGVPGGPALGRALDLADARAESPVETLARLALQPVLPQLVPQHRLVVGEDEVLARFDLGDEVARFAVECDGKAAHAGEAMVAKDRARDRTTEQRGWHTERVTWWDCRRERPAMVRRVVAEYQRHLRRAA